MLILSLFIHRQVVPNLYEFISVEHKILYFNNVVKQLFISIDLQCIFFNQNCSISKQHSSKYLLFSAARKGSEAE